VPKPFFAKKVYQKRKLLYEKFL